MLYDVTIIGGGIIGCAVARELMRYQLRVLLIEKECEVGFGTSKSNSGIIHAGHHSLPSTLKGRLEWVGNKMWDGLADELGFGFRRTGELTVALSDNQLGVLEGLRQQGIEKGVPGLEIWDRERIRREEPNLSEQVCAALYAPTSGVVNPYEAVFALLQNARRNGLDLLLESPVRAITSNHGSLAIRSDRALIHTRFVINAAGLYADQIAAMIGAQTFTIQPRKGEEYLLDKRLTGLVKRTIFPCPTPTSKGILVIPTFDGTIMVGPTAHSIEDRDDLTTTTAGAQEVFGEVRRIVPGISERDCIAAFAGLRAAADTEDFVIEPTAQKGFINVAGIQSPGLTSAPAIGVMVTDILRDEGLQLIPKDDFVLVNPKRVHFASLSTEDQIHLSREDPRYSHIICRCETVSEREVIDAIHDGARTLDGVKLRTRAGMGRCQGAFCSWRCMEMLARELALPMTAITKRGGGSWVLCEREDATC
jgi:glycerol-3-phosphate dehydrogenase